MTDKLRVIGGTMSPYSRKMVALLRYRQIPYQIMWGEANQLLAELTITPPKPVLYPVFLMPDADGHEVATVDSTPIIRTLEGEYSGRSVIPDDPVLAFLNFLIEDFADEWIVKYMFHYRWQYDRNIKASGPKLIYTSSNTAPQPMADQMIKMFTDRQINRLFWVGSNDITKPLIEASYHRFLKLMDDHLQVQPFMFGARPSSADFAIHGQLTQLIGEDPTSRDIAHDLSLRTVAWVDIMEDQSGVDGDNKPWNSADGLPDSLMNIFREIGRTFVPTMMANAKAAMEGRESFSCTVDDEKWEQPINAYQAKCMGMIRDEFTKLGVDDRARVLAIFDGTGCEQLVADIT